MKILALSDTHIGVGYEHRRDALADTAAMFDQVADLAVEREVALVVHAGDVFHRAKPSPPELHVFKRFCDRLAKAGISMVAIGGNGLHEAAPGHPSALELFASPLVRVSRRPEVILEANVAVCTLPAPGRASDPETAIDALLGEARRLYAKAETVPTQAPRVLLAHVMVSGASLPTGLPVEAVGSVVLPLWALEEIGYDAIVLGDIHRAQFLTPVGELLHPLCPTFYCGSPMTMDFGEQNEKHGCWIVEFGDGYPDVDFLALSDRRFVTVDVDLTEGGDWMQVSASKAPRLEGWSSVSDSESTVEAELSVSPGIAMTAAVPSPASSHLDETDVIASAIAERFPLADAVGRVRYRATEEQHRRVDHQALTKLLDDAGIHRLYGGISWEPVRESRARVAELDEDLDPHAAVDLWSETQGLDETQASGLRDLIGSWMGEA